MTTHVIFRICVSLKCRPASYIMLFMLENLIQMQLYQHAMYEILSTRLRCVFRRFQILKTLYFNEHSLEQNSRSSFWGVLHS